MHYVLNLKKLIQESECGDNTQNIRDIKHSVKIRDDIRRIDKMRSENPTMTQDDSVGAKSSGH